MLQVSEDCESDNFLVLLWRLKSRVEVDGSFLLEGYFSFLL